MSGTALANDPSFDDVWDELVYRGLVHVSTDAGELKKLLARFTVLYDLENNMEVDPAVVVLSGSGSNIGISADTLFQLSQLRKGG